MSVEKKKSWTNPYEILNDDTVPWWCPANGSWLNKDILIGENILSNKAICCRCGSRRDDDDEEFVCPKRWWWWLWKSLNGFKPKP